MKTLTEAWDLIETMNGTAYDTAYDSWLIADQEDDEELREDASAEQQEYFREEYADLTDEEQELIRYWYTHDKDFREQFETYYGGEL
jgi:hypothetical protein